LGIILKPQKVF